ncbi:hypothetical protein ACLJJ6_08330 [Pediococcus siamensis]|uniref:hypothetical protein n=1 Tax=Pediococcus siamensis TaxID=381829 RepID=UPI00399FDD0D
MINLKTKGGQKLLAAGNWAWSLFSINFAWFLINFPVILMMIILGSLDLNVNFFIINLVLTAMLIIFTVPSVIAAFATVMDWQVNGNGNFLRTQFTNWFKMLRYVRTNLEIGASFGVLIFLNKLFFGNVLPHMFVLTSSLILFAAFIVKSFQLGTRSTKSFSEICVAYPLKILVVTLIFIALLLLNFVLQLAFLIVIGSISLSVFVAYRLLGGRVEKND